MCNDESLRKQQMVELSILVDVDEFCNRHSINYSLCSGTLLGAIRHKGFIPWDDDIDICMLRDEYERFLTEWSKDPIENYVVVNHTVDISFNQTFTKICKENTSIIDDLDIIPSYHTGISIDIFPMDRIPDGKISRLIYWYRCAKYHLILHGYIPKNSNIIVKFISGFILFLSHNRYKAEDRLYRKITRFRSNRNLQLNFNDTNSTMRRSYPNDLFDRLTYVEFEGYRFPAFEKWHQELTIEFGNYMTLPPVEKRVRPHKPDYIDFEHNYTR